MSRYFLRFRHSDTGLTPTFTFFKKASDLTNQASPSISELGSGTYYFDYTPTFDVVFEVDGGASIPTEEVRYISDTLSPKDGYIDEPTSQVKDDVWNDATNRAPGTKGDFVEHIGIDTDAVDAATVFGKVYKARDAIMGGTGFGGTGENLFTARDRIMGGTGFGGTGVDVKTVHDRVGAPLGGFTSIADQLGDPSGANSIAQDIAAVQTSVGSANTDLGLIKGTGFATGTDSLKAISDNLVLVKAKTDNLPPDPADASDVSAAITAAVGSIKGGGVYSLTDLAGSGFSPSTDTLEKIRDAVGAIPAPDNANIALIKAQTDKIGDASDVSGASTVFGKTYEARDSITGTGYSSATMSLKANHENMLRVLGMLHENSVLDQTVFDGNNNMTVGRLRIYDSKANADAALAASPGNYNTGKIAEYAVQAAYTGANLTTYAVTKVP